MPSAGQQIAHYTLIRKLGRGAFGEVWLAENEDKFYAVKLPHEDQVDWEQIIKEIGIWVICGKHPNVLPFIDAKKSNGQFAIISEYAPDGSLEDLVKQKGKLSIEEAVEMTIGILDGLAHLSESGIIHRDLKPANILLDGKTPRLADFGISRIISADSLSKTLSGTWSYMAPECFDGKRNIKTDIWSVGVILYRMLAGYLPFQEKEFFELSAAIKFNEVEPLPNSIPLALQKIVAKALAKSPTERYQSAATMREELQEFLNVFLQTKESILIPYRKGDKFGFCDPDKNIIVPPKYDSVEFFSESLARVKLNGKYGLIDKVGTEILEPAYKYLRHSDDLIIIEQNGKYGAINLNLSSVVIPFRYDGIGQRFVTFDYKPFSEGLEVVNIDDEWYFGFRREGVPPILPCLCGFIDKIGNEVIPLKYHSAESFSNGLAKVSFNDKYGFIDKSGREVVPLKYDETSDSFEDGLAWVSLNGKHGLINYYGDEITPLIYDGIGELLSEDLIEIELNGKCGAIDKLGKEVIPIKYDYIGGFSEGLAEVRIDWEFGFIDKFGNEIIPPKYAQTASFSEGLACVSKGNVGSIVSSIGKCGFIDRFGNEVIPLEYERILPMSFPFPPGNYLPYFSEGLVGLQNNGKCGFIDKMGNIIIPFIYDFAGQFSKGLAKVFTNGKFGLIDKTGREVIPIKYDEVSIHWQHSATKNLIIVKSDGKYGFVDGVGNEVIPLKYDEANFFSEEGLAWVTVDGKSFYISKDGTEYYEPSQYPEQMRRVCPTCQTTYKDKALNFCLNDGSLLEYID